MFSKKHATKRINIRLYQSSESKRYSHVARSTLLTPKQPLLLLLHAVQSAKAYNTCTTKGAKKRRALYHLVPKTAGRRLEKQAFPIPTLSRSFVAAPFQLVLVRSSASTVLPPNPSACLYVGVWDKSWDKSANYFETVSP